MREIYQLYQGRLTVPQVLEAAGSNVRAQFYAHLYAGLYLHATGNRDASYAQITIAAEPRFAAVGGYMQDVARVHLMSEQ